MTKAARTPLRLHPAIPITVICLGLAFLVWAFFPIFKLVGQYFAIIAVLLGFRYWPPMARLVKLMPIPHRVVFGFLIAAMILGHLTLRPRTYFPFVAWEIFPTVYQKDPVTCPEFIAVTTSGKKIRLIVEQLFPSIVQIDRLDDYSPDKLDHLVQAMTKVYNEHHANDPVRRVDLMVMAVKLHPPANESRAHPSCEFLKSYNISSGR